MIVIYQNQANTVALTLTEKTTISNPYYLFSFTNVTTNEVQNFLVTDTSCATSRFNLFTITEGTTVSLDDTGQWDYTIYAQTSAVNTDPDLADELVEIGMVKVISTTANTDVTYTALDSEIDVQYDPE